MKDLVFYEVNENLAPLPHMTNDEEAVFDAINNAGAITERGLTKHVPGLTPHEIRFVLGGLQARQVIIRRNLSAHDTD